MASTVSQRRLGDLVPIHRPGMNPITEQHLRRLSDAELLRTATHPRNGQMVKARAGDPRVMDGNTRVLEMQRRMGQPNSLFTPNTLIPVEEDIP
jgi:hypothetical protein